MPTYSLNMADEKFINQVLEPEELTRRVPRLATFFEGIKEQRGALADLGTKGPKTGSTGWWKNGTAQYLGTVPISVKMAIQEIDPEFWEDQRKVMRFFATHPEYVVTSVSK